MKAFPTFARLTPIIGLVLVLIALGMSTGAQTVIPLNAELLTNGGFETAGSGNANAAGWTRYNADNDRRVCDQMNAANAHTGVCAFRFVGMAGRTTTLTQAVKPAVGAAGESLSLSAFVTARKLTAQTAVLRIKVVYVGGGKDKAVIPLSGGSYPYQAVSAGLNLTGTVQKLRVQVVMNGGSGRFFVDDVSLMLTPTPEATATSSPTNTETAIFTETPTATAIATDTKTPTNTPTHTSTPTATSTPTLTATATLPCDQPEVTFVGIEGHSLIYRIQPNNPRLSVVTGFELHWPPPQSLGYEASAYQLVRVGYHYRRVDPNGFVHEMPFGLWEADLYGEPILTDPIIDSQQHGRWTDVSIRVPGESHIYFSFDPADISLTEDFGLQPHHFDGTTLRFRCG